MRFGCDSGTDSNHAMRTARTSSWELRNIFHHHPESKKRKSSEENSGFIHPYGRYGNVAKTRTTISTIAILWPVKAIFEKMAATVEVDSFVSPVKYRVTGNVYITVIFFLEVMSAWHYILLAANTFRLK